MNLERLEKPEALCISAHDARCAEAQMHFSTETAAARVVLRGPL